LSVYIFGRKLLQDELQKFLADYYPYAYAVSEQFRTPYLGDDQKEDIALKALERAVKTYDPDKGTKFSSYLYTLIMNDLKSETVKMKKKPLSVRDVPEPETGERRDVFDFIADYKILEESDPTFYNELVTELNKKLTPRQKQLLDMLKSPQIYIDKFNKMYEPEKPLTKLNYEAIGKMLDVSIATVTYELRKIQNVTQEILNNLERVSKEK